MMKAQLFMSGIVAVFFVLPQLIYAPTKSDTFVLVDEKDGVKLYERWHTTADAGQYRELKAVFQVQQPQQQVMLDALRREEVAMRWMQDTDIFDYLSDTQNRWHTYVKYALPWPLKDLDCVLLFQQTSPRTGLMRITFESARLPAYPPKSGVERMNQLSGSWEFRSLSDSHTEVTHYVMTRKPSPYPRFLIDPIVRSNLIDTMAAFRKEVQAH